MFDGQRFGAEIVEAVKGYLARAIDPVLARIVALEQRLAEKPRDGRDADPAVIKALVDAAVTEAVRRFEPPADAKLIFVEELAPLVAREVREAVAKVPSPEPGRPGKDADPVMVGEIVEAAVAKAFAALPPVKSAEDLEIEIQAAVETALATRWPEDVKAVNSLVAEAVAKLALPTNAEMERVLAELGRLEAVHADLSRLSASLDERIEAGIAQVSERLDALLAKMPPPKDGEPGKSVTVDDVAPMIADEVEKAVHAIQMTDELAAVLVERVLAKMPKPEPGKSVTVEELAPVIAEEVAAQVAALPPAEPGKSVTLEELAPVVATAVETAIAALPPAEPGKPGDPGEPGKDADPVLIAELIGREVEKQIAALPKPKDGDPGKPGEPGASVNPEDVAQMISTEVDKRMGAIPVPKDGISVTLDDVAPMVSERVTAEVARQVPEAVAAAKPKDVAGAVIDRDGRLQLTLSDGTLINLGEVVGRSVTDAEVQEKVAAAVAAIPKPRDGIDGLGFDDLEIAHDGERGFIFRLTNDNRVKEFPFVVPMVIYRGIWREGAFEKGDAVTWAGSLWIAERDTDTKPDAANGGWRLAVKRGRDGKGS